MLEKTTIARPYSEAAFEQAREEDSLESWSELLSVLAMAVSDSQMHALLENPRVTTEQVLDIVKTLVGSDLGNTQHNFIQVLVEAERLQFVPAMQALFEESRLDAEGLAKVEVTSAHPLEESQRERIKEAMVKRLNRKIELTENADEALIGGAVIRNGDSVIDASVRGQLDELRGQLT